jgi:hypothetical protein
MYTFKRSLSLLLAFQLCYSCTGAGGGAGMDIGSGGSSSGGGAVIIKGLISGVFHRVSETVLPEAIAQEGRIDVYDSTDPTQDPKFIKSFVVEKESEGYSIELTKEEAEGKLLELNYSGVSGVREIIINVDEGESAVDAEINEDNHFESQILKEQLKLEFSESNSVSDLRERFKSLKALKDVSSDLSIFSDSSSMKEVLKDEKNGAEMRDLIVKSRVARDKGKEDEEKKYQEEILKLASNVLGVEVTSHGNLFCSANKARFFINEKKSYRIMASPVNLELIRKWGAFSDLGEASDSEYANRQLRGIGEELANIGKDLDKLLAIDVTISDPEGIQEDKQCRLYSRVPKEGEDEPQGIELDLSPIKEISFEEVADVDELRRRLSESLKKVVENFEETLKGLELEENIAMTLHDREVGKAQRLLEQRLKDYETFLSEGGAGLQIKANLSYLQNVNFDEVDSFSRGHQLLQEALKATITELREQLQKLSLNNSIEESVDKFTQASFMKVEERADYVQEAPVELQETSKTVADGELKILRDDLDNLIEPSRLEPESAYEAELRLVNDLYLKRLEELRSLIENRLESDYPVDASIINSVDIEKLEFSQSVYTLRDAFKQSLELINQKIPQDASEELRSEILASQVVGYQKLVLAKINLLNERDYSSDELTSYKVDVSSLISFKFDGYASDEAMNEVSRQTDLANNSLIDKLKSDGVSAEVMEKVLSEQVPMLKAFHMYRSIEVNICYTPGSLIPYCQKLEAERLIGVETIKRERMLEQQIAPVYDEKAAAE